MDFREEDLEILKNETGLNYDKAVKLLKESQGDVVSAILKFSGEEIEKVEVPKKLTDVEKKIRELRDILDKKDEILEGMLQKQKQEEEEEEDK